VRIHETRQQHMIGPRNAFARLETGFELRARAHGDDASARDDDRLVARCRGVRRDGQKPPGRDQKIRGFLGLHRRGST
jgi:hypothetical protein